MELVVDLSLSFFSFSSLSEIFRRFLNSSSSSAAAAAASAPDFFSLHYSSFVFGLLWILSFFLSFLSFFSFSLFFLKSLVAASISSPSSPSSPSSCLFLSPLFFLFYISRGFQKKKNGQKKKKKRKKKKEKSPQVSTSQFKGPEFNSWRRHFNFQIISFSFFFFLSIFSNFGGGHKKRDFGHTTMFLHPLHYSWDLLLHYSCFCPSITPWFLFLPSVLFNLVLFSFFFGFFFGLFADLSSYLLRSCLSPPPPPPSPLQWLMISPPLRSSP